MIGRPRKVKPTRMKLRDLLAESIAGTLARPGRTVLTMIGVVLGVGTVVTVLGLTSTAGGQISKKFNVLTATEVIVRQPEPAPGSQVDGSIPFTADADSRARQIRGVKAAGVAQEITAITGEVSGVPLPGAQSEQVPVFAASPGFLPAIGTTLRSGRFFDAGHAKRSDPVVVIGPAVADRLGISRLEVQPVIFIGGTAFTVIGIIDDVVRRPDILTAILIPRQSALAVWPEIEPAGAQSSARPAEMEVDTTLGAGPVVADQIALALRPDNPNAFVVVPPPDPRELRDSVQADLNTLFLLLAAICLIIGMLGIANTTLVAVLERTSEIGLRRALGARKRHVANQFLTESAIVGTLGGLMGAAIGVLAIVAVAVAKDWTPILNTATVLPAPFVGTVIGVIAGFYPSLRAAAIPPAEAFRR